METDNSGEDLRFLKSPMGLSLLLTPKQLEFCLNIKAYLIIIYLLLIRHVLLDCRRFGATLSGFE